jgi:hypothetical protein
MLSIYIEDKSDEGSYQCVDSKSDTPIKKTIKLFLSKFFLKFISVVALKLKNFSILRK